ncbi:hypothetical protein [Lysobacter antibioticus]|uniref:hypothetical protein n=1 Tax=Lysobacter antibioticus TaxID=84531 RepID=UPI0004D00009|nr:hypothetical protein [Lysobacter antibioticus]
MKTRAQLDAGLERLSQMLPPWLESLRHEAQFWPQFRALVDELMADADPVDRAHAQRRIDEMLARHGLRWR